MTLFQNPLKNLFKERDARLDFLKFFAMLLVVLDHSLQRWCINPQNSIFYNLIFITQMPLFMFVSGYLFYKKSKQINSAKDLGIVILKSAASLLIPFFVFSFLTSLIFGDFGRNPFIAMYQSILNPENSLWFLWALFFQQIFLALASYITNKITNKEVIGFILKVFLYCILLIIPVALFIFMPGMFATKYIVYYSLFLLFGFLVNFISGILVQKEIKHPNVYQIIAICLAACVVGVCCYLRPTMIFDEETIVNMALRVVASVSSIVFFFFLFKYLVKSKPIAFISKFGIYSLELYFMHLFLFKIPLLTEKLAYSTGVNIVAFIGLYLLTLAISFGCILAIKSIPVLDACIFGKINFKKK